MGKIIAICNQKGGVGKTTTAVNLSAFFALGGVKTLLLDVDPQGNATSGVGIDKNKVEHTIYQALLGQLKVEDIVKIMEYGVLHTPALVIDEQVVMSGRLPSKKDLEELLTQKQ